MLSTDNWCIKVNDKVYGPYTVSQLKSFHAEGRLSEQSLISPAGGKSWRYAAQCPSIASVFKAPEPAKHFGKKSSVLGKNAPAEGQLSSFVLVFDNKSGAASRLEQRIRAMGSAFRIADNVWALTSAYDIMDIQSDLGPHLQFREPLFITDAQRARSAWFNFTPDIQTKFSKAWLGQTSKAPHH